MQQTPKIVVLIKGGGEVASGVAHRLHRGRLRVCITEIARPVAVSRGTTFSEAVFDGTKTIMGVTAELVATSLEGIQAAWQRGNIALVIDPETSIKETLKPDVLIDAIMAKRNTGTMITDAPLVIGLGPGFYAGRDVHIVVETNHSQNLGKMILDGEAEKNTSLPIAVGGLSRERVVWADQGGVFITDKKIGDVVVCGERVGWIGEQPVVAPTGGMLRGLLRSGVSVPKGKKLIEVDPVNDPSICSFIADKIRVIAEGIHKAIMLRYGII